MVREAEERQLVKESCGAREEREMGATGPVVEGAEIRWGLRGDEPVISELLRPNGMPRRVASGERFVVAEKGEKVLVPVGRGGYLALAGYRRRGNGWRMEVSKPNAERSPMLRRWRATLALLGVSAMPLFLAFKG